MSEAIDLQQVSGMGANLYIFLGGIAAGITIPPFEFYNAAKILEDDKIFIRDFSQCWYQAGLPGAGTDIHGIAQYLRAKIAEINPEKVFFVGNSMGGFAAIALAGLVGQGEVIAFAPQTFIAPWLRFKHRDRRWKKQVGNAYWQSWRKPHVWDLRPLLQRQHSPRNIAVFVSRSDRLDYLHAQHIRDIPGVVVHEFETGGHDVVKLLRDAGSLPAIMAGTYHQHPAA